jgi:hypothetical protein
MDAAVLIASLVSLETSAAKTGDQMTRDFVIEAQDCVLRMQRENLELRRENQVLRLRQRTPREESSHPRGTPTDLPPFIFRALGSRRAQRAADADPRNAAMADLAPAI